MPTEPLIKCVGCGYVASEEGFYLIPCDDSGFIGYAYRCPDCDGESIEDVDISEVHHGKQE